MGCGSVGGVIAGGLLRSAYDLTIVTNNDEITNAIKNDGIRVSAPKDEWTVHAQAHTQLQDLQGTFDTVLLAMKATDVEQAVEDLRAYLSPSGYVVTLQNGIVEDRIGEMLGRERVIGALVGWGATMRKPGLYEMTSLGEVVIGELDGQITSRAERLQSTLEKAIPTSLSDNIYGVLWSKLTINCIITTLGAVTGQLLGEMLNRSSVRRLALLIASEVIDVAKSLGISMEPVGETLEMERIYLPIDRRHIGFGWDIFVRHIIMLVVGIKFRRLKSSMLQSLERGRPAEIEFMNGYVAQKGEQSGVPTPINTALTSMVREIDSGQRQIDPQNLDELIQVVK
jgi:2-dehydropantoate 2-reductase